MAAKVESLKVDFTANRAAARKPAPEPQESFEQTLESARAKPRETETPAKPAKPQTRKTDKQAAADDQASVEENGTAEKPKSETISECEASEESEGTGPEESSTEQSPDQPDEQNTQQEGLAVDLAINPQGLPQANGDVVEIEETELPEAVVTASAQNPRNIKSSTAPVNAQAVAQASVEGKVETASQAATTSTVAEATAESPENPAAAQDTGVVAQKTPEAVPHTVTSDQLTATQEIAQSVGSSAPKPEIQIGAGKASVPQPAAPQQTPDQQFSSVNHPGIVTGIRGQLLPNGGTMTLKLDPPELGALQVSVHMRDGMMTASFQTSNDDATRLLSHSLGQLKQSLESQGINVDKIHVQQTPRDQQAGNQNDPQQDKQQTWDQPGSRQEQQRREMLQRMWRKLAGAEDPLDLMA